MAQSDNRKQFLVEFTGCAIWVNKSSLKFLRFSFSAFQRNVRTDFFGSAAGGLPAMLRKAIAGGGRRATLRAEWSEAS
jgi:hypothetical protein